MATRAPRASSQARVNGEKKAPTGSVGVWTTDRKNEHTMMTAVRHASLVRSEMRNRSDATMRKRAG